MRTILYAFFFLALNSLVGQEPVIFPMTRVNLQIPGDGKYQVQIQSSQEGSIALVFLNEDGSISALEETFGSRANFLFYYSEGDRPQIIFQPAQAIADAWIKVDIAPAMDRDELVREIARVITEDYQEKAEISFIPDKAFFLNENQALVLLGDQQGIWDSRSLEKQWDLPVLPEDSQRQFWATETSIDLGGQKHPVLAYHYPPNEGFPGEVMMRILLGGEWKVFPAPEYPLGSAPSVEWREGYGEFYMASYSELVPQGLFSIQHWDGTSSWEFLTSFPLLRDSLVKNWGVNGQGNPWVHVIRNSESMIWNYQNGLWERILLPTPNSDILIQSIGGSLLILSPDDFLSGWEYSGEWKALAGIEAPLLNTSNGIPMFFAGNQRMFWNGYQNNMVLENDRDVGWIFPGSTPLILYLTEDRSVKTR